MKRWQITLLGMAALAGTGFWMREPLMLGWLASRTEQTTLDQRQQLLESAIDIRLPETGDGPFPVVLQFHGCAGVDKPFHRQWADIANRAGYAAMIVDSVAPRGYSREKALEVICKGKKLLGQERAGDILAAIKIAEADPRLDTDHLVLAAWSHGAWTVMDYLAMDMKKHRPAGLAPADYAPPDIDGVILFYPYCGIGALSRFRAWTQTPPMLALIGGADIVVNAGQCISLLEKKKAAGAPIDIVVYPDANHVFDDPFLEPEWAELYNEDAFKDATKKYTAFLVSLDPVAP